MQKSLIERIQQFLDPITSWQHFDRVTGAISLLNPLALLPQLWSVIVNDDVGAVSVGMWSLFILLQITFSLVAIKSKNSGMFIAMIISMVISASIIAVVVTKTHAFL